MKTDRDNHSAEEKAVPLVKKNQSQSLKVVVCLFIAAFLLGGFSVVCLNTLNIKIKLPSMLCHDEVALTPEHLYFYDDYFETTSITGLNKRADETDKQDKTADKKDDKTDDKKDEKTDDKKDDKTTDKKDDKTTDKKDDNTDDKKTDKTDDKKDDKTDDKKNDKTTDDKKDDKTDDKKGDKTDDKKDDKSDSKDEKSSTGKPKVVITRVKTNTPPPGWSDSASKSESELKGPTAPLDQGGVRFALALAGLIVINMIAICIHHIYHVASDSTKSYRNMEQDISPF